MAWEDKPWDQRLFELTELSDNEKGELHALIMALPLPEHWEVAVPKVRTAAVASLRKRLALAEAGRSAPEAPPDVKPVQVSSDTRCYVELLIKGTVGKQMEAQALADTGFTRDLLISEYKANELGLSPDGYVTTATAAGGSQLTMHRYRSVAVAVHVEDKFGNKSYINEFMLECWALPGTDKPNSIVTGILAPSPTLDASCFTDCALTVEASSSPAKPSTSSPAEPSTFSPAKPSTSSPAKPSMSAHETEGGVYRISPVRLGQDRYGHDILLGRSGMLRLKLGFDKSTGDMICTLHSPDAVL